MKQTKKKLFSLMKNKTINENHGILKKGFLEEQTLPAISINEDNEKQNNSVWPVEERLLIEKVDYSPNSLAVKVNNISDKTIKIISEGVKYTSNERESINFVTVNYFLPPGNSAVSISCARGNPFKFVLRTEDITGIGKSRKFANW